MINTPSTSNGFYALVAGGSKGIGYAVAEALAKRKYNLVLIARHPEGLSAAKIKLESEYPVHVETLSYDLGKENSATEVAAWCIEQNISLQVLCNIAGYGGSRDYLLEPMDAMRYMVRLNIESGMGLSQPLISLLEKNAPAYILNVASMAGLSPLPIKNIYSATKAAVIFFSYALHYQLREKNISVSCLAPGPVYTKPEIEKETRKQLGKFGDKMAVPVKKVGEIAVRNTFRGRILIIPGFLPKIIASFLRIMPRKMATAIYSRLGKK